MSSSGKNTFLKIIEIDVLKAEEAEKESLEDKITQTITQKYPKSIELTKPLTFSIDEVKASFIMQKTEGFFILRTITEYKNKADLDELIKEKKDSYNFSDILLETSTIEPYTRFTVFVYPSEDVVIAESLIERFSGYLSLIAESVSIIRGMVLSIFNSREGDINKRYFLLSPITKNNINDQYLEELVNIIEEIAYYTSELTELEKDSKNIFSVLDLGEIEISERVEGYLWKLLGPESVDLETLESWLSYIMERDSTLSAMIGRMKVNYSEAESILLNIESLFSRLKGGDLEGFPENHMLELDKYTQIVRNFHHYIIRSEALKSRLETVMEEVRTYLSLQQQKLAIEEQKSSREQLMRLVNLQEIFHKVEIFIVAVYITEMAHIIFEVLAHDKATLFTAMFIPVALLLAVVVSRMLHKNDH